MLKRTALVILIATSVGCRREKEKPSPHGDPAIVAPLRAALNAPEGATPCETAHNAFIALDQACVAAKMPAPWPVLPKREEFLDACQRMPLDMQLCLAPRYNNANHGKCKLVTEQTKTDPWGKIVFKMINEDGSATAPAPVGASSPVLPH